MARVRPHFKTHLTLEHHRKTADVYADNDLMALHTRLGMLAIEQFAAKNGGRFRVHRSQLSRLTGGKRRDKAEALLLRLATLLQLTCKLHGSYFDIEWPKLFEKQGFNEKNGQRTVKELQPQSTLEAPPPSKGGAPLVNRTPDPLPIGCDWPGALEPKRSPSEAGHRARLRAADPSLQPVSDVDSAVKAKRSREIAEFRARLGSRLN